MMSTKDFYDNDIYFMKRVGNKIILNNNYEGILILDAELNIIKEEKLLDDLLISDCFVNQDTKEIMLYAYENHCFAYFDTVNYIKKIIPIQEEFKEFFFQPSYEWKSNKLLLLADAGAVVICIDILKGIIKEVSGSITSAVCSEGEFLSKYIVRKVDPYEKIAVIEEGKDIKIVNLETRQVAASYSGYHKYFHDIEVSKEFFAFISESEFVIYNGKKCILKLAPIDNFYFLRGTFFVAGEITYFYVLSSCNADCRYCKVERYLLETV